MVVAKKKFGQNFLVNKDAKSKLATLVQLFLEKARADQVLEIGPGLGDLTEISAKILPVLAVEIDPEIVEIVKSRFELEFSLEHKSELYLGDFYQWQKEIIDSQNIKLKLENKIPQDFMNKFLNSQLALVSNLPYNLGSRILVDLALARPDTPFMVILQEEVVDKMVRTDEYFTFFGAWLNLFWDFKKETILPRHYFNPQPNVTSALISAFPKPLTSFLLTIEQRLVALNLLKNLFSMPSKTISNNLRKIGWKLDKTEELLNSLKLEKSSRLNKDNYEAVLYKILCVDKDKALNQSQNISILL